MGAAEVAGLALGKILPLLVADEHHLDVIEVSKPRHDRLVVAEGAVAVQFEKLLENQIEVVAGLGALLVSRNLNNLPWIQIGIDLTLELRQLAAQPPNLLGDRRGVAPRAVLGVLYFHLTKASFHLVDGRLEG